LRPTIYEDDYEKQYALHEANQYEENQKTERVLHHDLAKYSLKQLQSDIYELDFEKQYALHEAKQFNEFHRPEQTLDRDST
ncbi:unnamed protein product, partial [Rotaria magnacalcarata]